MFLISSGRFRREIKDRIFCFRIQNQINPVQPPTRIGTTLENKINN
jgi:hypothetical protein